MRRVVLACGISLLLAATSWAAAIKGQYLETRNASMWAGPCVVNSELGIVGNKATLAWKVTEGTLDNVRLDGLAIVALVFGDRTFGTGEVVNTRTIFIVDNRADAAQQQALIRMARALAAGTIQEVVAVKRAPIQMEVAGNGYSRLDAGPVRIRTRQLHRSDSLCGTDNHRMVYPTLAKVHDEHPGFTLENVYTGGEVEVKAFEDRNVPSAVLASFSLR